MKACRAAVIAVLVALLAAAPWRALAAPHAAGPYLANHCFTVAAAKTGRFLTAAKGGRAYSISGRSRKHALRFFLKPTRLGAYLLYDSGGKLLSTGMTRAAGPSADAEWSLRRRARTVFTIRSTSKSHRALAHGARFHLRRASKGCRRYPEAALGARRVKPNPGGLGFADPHVHIPAALRAGGLVVSGQNFDRFGITEALGHDADVHGGDGSLDVTGNLLRSGAPTGTHDTHGWPSFTGWPTFDTYTHQQIYYRWLERVWMGGERLVVAQTVEDESLCNIEPRKSHSCDETATVEAEVGQLRRLQDYIDAQSGGRGRGWFRLVYGPKAARRVIAHGKLAVLIGVESSNPFGCSEFEGQPHCTTADIDRGIERMRRIGVRTMFLAHWVDNALAGAALEGGDKGQFIASLNAAQTGQPFTTGACPHPEQGEEVLPPAPLPGTQPVSGSAPVTAAQAVATGRQCNTRGLTDLGEYAVRQMIAKHMLIEVDHLSEWARERVLDIADQEHYPLVSSHTGTGGLWTADELTRLYAQGGFASATIDDAAKLPGKILAFTRYGGARAGVGLGTDTGGFNALPAPAADAASKPLAYPFRSYDGRVRFTRQRTGSRGFDINRDGVAHYGLLPDLLADVQRQPRGRRALGLLFHSAAAYVRTWELAVRR